MRRPLLALLILTVPSNARADDDSRCYPFSCAALTRMAAEALNRIDTRTERERTGCTGPDAWQAGQGQWREWIGPQIEPVCGALLPDTPPQGEDGRWCWRGYMTMFGSGPSRTYCDNNLPVRSP